jgi:hypothetical protein
MHEFEEIEISRQGARRKPLKPFVWISSKNSASGQLTERMQKVCILYAPSSVPPTVTVAYRKATRLQST